MTTTTNLWRITAEGFPTGQDSLGREVGVVGLSLLAVLHDEYRQAEAAEDKGFMSAGADVELQGHAAVATLRHVTARLFTGGDDALAQALLDLYEATT